MAGGTSDGNGGTRRPDEEHYDWLYSTEEKGVGSSFDAYDAPPARPGEPEPTRVLPRPTPPNRPHQPSGYQPGRPAQPPPGGPGRPPQGPRPPMPAPATTGRRRPRFRARWLLWLVVAYLVFLVAVPLYAWSSVSRVNATPSGKRPAEQPGTTYLVVGSDARAGLAGRRTDTIMLLHTGSGPNVLMSIPRDSLVEVPGHGVTKINAAFAYGGPRLLTRTIEGSTGIRVDDYVEIGFTGFVDLVDAVGGITICPKQNIKDPLAHLNIRKGCQEVDGKVALGYARSRHAFALGDIARAQHQREVVSAIGDKVVSPATVLNPFRYWKVVTAGADTVRVDKETGPLSAAKFAYAMTRVNGTKGLTCGVPIADLAVHWDTERANRLFDLIASDQTDQIGKDLCQPTGLAR